MRSMVRPLPKVLAAAAPLDGRSTIDMRVAPYLDADESVASLVGTAGAAVDCELVVLDVPDKRGEMFELFGLDGAARNNAISPSKSSREEKLR